MTISCKMSQISHCIEISGYKDDIKVAREAIEKIIQDPPQSTLYNIHLTGQSGLCCDTGVFKADPSFGVNCCDEERLKKYCDGKDKSYFKESAAEEQANDLVKTLGDKIMSLSNQEKVKEIIAMNFETQRECIESTNSLLRDKISQLVELSLDSGVRISSKEYYNGAHKLIQEMQSTAKMEHTSDKMCGEIWQDIIKSLYKDENHPRSFDEIMKEDQGIFSDSSELKCFHPLCLYERISKKLKNIESQKNHFLDLVEDIFKYIPAKSSSESTGYIDSYTQSGIQDYPLLDSIIEYSDYIDSHEQSKTQDYQPLLNGIMESIEMF